MQDGSCRLEFPFNITDCAAEGDSGFVLYRGRDSGRTSEQRGCLLGNRWVAPYYPAWSLRARCHVNVPVRISIAPAKYLFYFLFEGAGHATVRQDMPLGVQGGGESTAHVSVEIQDEITRYLSARYISAREAAWRAFQFPTHHVQPPVTRLQVHFPGSVQVYFDPD